MRYNTRKSQNAEELWDSTKPEDDAKMSANDKKFCEHIMNQLLKNSSNEHFTEPLLDTVNLPAYQDFPRHVDLDTIDNCISTDYYGSLNEFKKDLQLVVNNCKTVEKDDKGLFYDKANDLQHHLVKLFDQKKSLYARWDKERQQQQSEQSASAPSASTSAPSVATGIPASAHVGEPAAAPTSSAAVHATSLAPSSAPSEPLPSVTRIMPFRPSATPTPSRWPNHQSARAEVQATINEVLGHSSNEMTEDEVIGSSEMPDQDSELLQARRGKRKATDGEDTGTDHKRARQETPKYKYRDLRVEVAGVFDREMSLVYEGNSSIELDENAQRYVYHVSQMDAQAMDKAKKADLNEIKEDHIEQIEERIVEAVQDFIHTMMAGKGQLIQPRVSLPSRMDEEEDHSDVVRSSQTRVKREQQR